AEPFDLYVFDGWLPNDWPGGDMLIINPPNSTPLVSVDESLPATDEIEISTEESPITSFVDLDEMSLLQFRAIDAAWAQPLIRAGGEAIVAAGEVNAQQIAILPFDLRDSNLPLLIAWPVLMANLLDWFSPSDIVSLPDGLTVGDVLVISPPLLADGIRVTTPDGTIHDLPVEGDMVAFAETGKLGLYRLEVLQAGEVTSAQSFAVNLFATGESDIGPVPETDLQLGGGLMAAEADEQLGTQEFWMWLALAALLLLAIEWYVYHRRLQVPTVLNPAPRRFRFPWRGLQSS
ncbi:MAG: hypothetical protein OXG23_11700, partial [Chloroflexi bacterium]|nr:hypothetical protein [Chloroflexota bacterium]